MKWDFYRDRKGEWCWRCKANNNKIISASTEGYKNKEDCMANARMMGYERDMDKTVSVDVPISKPGILERLFRFFRKITGTS